MAQVRLNEVSRQFGRVVAIDRLTFAVPDGEFWVLVGPSGCGKSTVLRAIAGLETATSGELYIGDRLVNQVPARQRDVAMVFQNYALYPHMSVAKNLAFGLQMRNVDAKTIQARIETVAEMLNIRHLLDRTPRQLSGGQQQRVALGRAIARQPQVFLLDEPLSNLDAQLRDETRAELKQLHDRVGITTLYVTHDQTEAMTLADQIVVLNQGHIQQIGDPATIYARPANRMVAAFLGNPPMNLLPATSTNAGWQVGQQTLPSPLELHSQLRPGQSIELGIRPEHLRLSAEGPLAVEAVVVEPLGRETLIRAKLLEPDSNILIQFLVEPSQRIRVGDRLSLQLAFEHVFLFDLETGDRLHPL